MLKNEAMPGYIKIGRTSGDSEEAVKARMCALDTTSVPLPFECLYAAVVENAPEVERNLHRIFERDRRRTNREFFEDVPDHSAIAALKIANGKDVTPKTQPEKDADGATVIIKPSKRPPLRFAMVGIKPGAKLTFSRDENITCTVEDYRHVKYDGELYTLSALAQKFLPYSYSVAGPSYWMYEGELLSVRRNRMEGEESDTE